MTLIKRSLFNEVEPFSDALIQLCDSEFWCRIMVNHGAAFVSDSLASFRVHQKATTTSNRGSRRFRFAVLDPLVLRYRFGFDRRFDCHTDRSISGKGAWEVRRACASAAAHAWWHAKQASDDGDGSLMVEWRSVASSCPGLDLIATMGGPPRESNGIGCRRKHLCRTNPTSSSVKMMRVAVWHNLPVQRKETPRSTITCAAWRLGATS